MPFPSAPFRIATPTGIPLQPHPVLSYYPVPHIAFIISFLLRILVFALPPSRHRLIIFTPLILITSIISQFGPIASEPDAIFAFATKWPHNLFTFSFLLYPDPEHYIWRNGEQPGEAATWPFGIKKLKWSLSLSFSPRGIGWNWRLKNTPEYSEKYKGEGRLSFIVRKLSRAAILLLLCDAAHTLVLKRYRLGDGMYVSTEYGGYGLEGLWRKGVIAYVCYAGILWGNTVVSVIAVGLGIDKPEEWPDLFGSFKDLTTVRHFWGKCWHQILRRPLEFFSRIPSSFLGLPMNSPLSIFLRLSIAFSISGIGHALPLIVMPNYNYILPTGTLKFYIAQGFIICIESFVLDMYVKMTGDVGKGGWRRIVGHVWVGLWFATVAPWFWDDMLVSGVMDKNILPFSIVSWLTDRNS